MAESQQKDPDATNARDESMPLAESIRQHLSELEARVARIIDDQEKSPIEQQEAKVIKAVFGQFWRKWNPDDDAAAMLALLAFNLGQQVQRLDNLRQQD